MGEVKPTTVTLQLADRSVIFPRGVVENVLVKVKNLILPADFIVLDIEEDGEVPLIMGRPFLATGRTLIDVVNGELIMRVYDEFVVIKVFTKSDYLEDIRACKEEDSCDDFKCASCFAMFVKNKKKKKDKDKETVKKNISTSLVPNSELDIQDLGSSPNLAISNAQVNNIISLDLSAGRRFQVS